MENGIQHIFSPPYHPQNSEVNGERNRAHLVSALPSTVERPGRKLRRHFQTKPAQTKRGRDPVRNPPNVSLQLSSNSKFRTRRIQVACGAMPWEETLNATLIAEAQYPKQVGYQHDHGETVQP
ncbi:hypothetical protein ANCCEY_01836 [Ancylostoma ceylanicum]|uniref:Uncharacterized protein n=2 Tax=Ancylostoma ceylanicum TaxID=53326 RepID=A0A016SHH0_9BILA|nr:hypothetical protein ANCCEY_01836 [Ancylostoma ceylanicum]EYB89764.1 hypothetical protein Y032_0228g2886 [Ancylostoma ceylanicum]